CQIHHGHMIKNGSSISPNALASPPIFYSFTASCLVYLSGTTEFPSLNRKFWDENPQHK
ncbi:hypothetical protein KI387_029091, partial [Taxus chinensis]